MNKKEFFEVVVSIVSPCVFEEYVASVTAFIFKM
jgi:hypothetical protein